MNLLFLTFVFPLIGFLLLSFSLGRFSENLSALIPEVIPANVFGGAIGLINACGALGAFVGSWIVGYLIGLTGNPGVAYIFMTAGVLSSALLSATKGWLLRKLAWCTALAKASLPVPVSPSINSGASSGAMRRASRTNYYSRGFSIVNFQYDGIPTLRDAQYSAGQTLTDMAIYDKAYASHFANQAAGRTALLTTSFHF